MRSDDVHTNSQSQHKLPKTKRRNRQLHQRLACLTFFASVSCRRSLALTLHARARRARGRISRALFAVREGGPRNKDGERVRCHRTHLSQANSDHLNDLLFYFCGGVSEQEFPRQDSREGCDPGRGTTSGWNINGDGVGGEGSNEELPGLVLHGAREAQWRWRWWRRWGKVRQPSHVAGFPGGGRRPEQAQDGAAEEAAAEVHRAGGAPHGA
jgi:hypothetical protein